MGKQEGESRWWAHSKSSTVLLDPAAVVENWKRQIQGKDGIPLQQQRLTFKVANQEEEESSSQRPKNSIFEDSYKGRAAADLIKDLQTWKALLRCNNVIVGKLENPVVEAESEKTATNLYCQAAQELRSIGIPCDVFYLSFDKWIPATWQLGSPPDLSNKTNRSPVKLSIEVDKYSNYRIDLVGRLEGRGTALVFEYRMNGGEVHTQLSMLQQTAQYRQGQQMRHRGLRSPPVGKGITRDAEYADDNGQAHALTLTPEHQTHFGKELEFFVSSDSKHLKCFVFTVISVPPDTRRKLEQLVPPPSCQQDCEGRLQAAGAVRKDSRLICLSPPRLSPADLTENTAHSSHRTLADQSHHFQRSLNNHIPVSHTAEYGSDTSLLWLSGQQPSPSQDPVSSSSTGSTAESVLEGADRGSLQIFKDELSVKQSKKKKKKKGKKKTTRNAVENGDTLAQEGDVLSPEELSTVCLKSSVSPPADVKMHQSSLQGTSSPESMDNSNHVGNSEKNPNASKKSKSKAPTVDNNDMMTESAAELVHCQQEPCVEASDKFQQQKSCPGSCGYQGVPCECGVESNWQGIWSPLQCEAKNLSNLVDGEHISGRNVGSNSQNFIERRSARSKADQALSYGLRRAASYCEDSGRLAPVMFLNEVCTTAGAYERGTLSPRKVENCQTDPAAARDVTSDGRKNPVAHTVLGPLPSRAGQTLLQANGESIQDVKGSVWGGSNVGSRNGGGGGAPPESNGSRGQGKASEDRRGASSNYTGGNGQGSGRNTSQGSGVGGGSTSGGGGSGSGGGNGNRGGGGGGSNGSGGGGWDCGNDWHWEAEISGKKERRNAVEGEDRSSRNGFVAGVGGEAASGEHVQRRAAISTTLDHRVRRGSAGDTLHNGSSGSGYVATIPTVGNAPAGKENILVWKPKLNSHEDESLLCEPSRLRISDSGEGISGPELPHQVLCPNAASVSICGGVSIKSSEKAAYSNGYVVGEGFVSKDTLTGSSDQNLRRGEEHTYRPIRKVAVTSESGSKVGRELYPAAVASDNTTPNGGFFRQRGKEGSFVHVGNSQSQETVKPTWLKKSTPPPNGPEEQPQAASKGGPEVPHHLGNGRPKYMNIRPLNVHFPHTPTVKETQTMDAFPAFWTRSAPSTPYSQSGEADFHDGGQLDYHHNPLSGPILHGRYHMNGVAGSGHFRDSRMNQEDSTQRWRPHRRVMLDHDKFGADKERMAPMLPVQKWVPVDKGTTNSQKGSGARSTVEAQVTPASSLCTGSKDSESMLPNGLISQFGSAVSVMEKNITKDICEIKEVNSRSREDVSEDGNVPPSKALSHAPSDTSSEGQHALVGEVVTELQNGTVLPCTSVVDQLDPPIRSTDLGASVVGNCAASLSSRLDSAIQDSSVKSVGVTQLIQSSSDRLNSCTTARSSRAEELGSVLEGDCEIQVIDVATQKLNLLVTESIQGSSKGREASEAVAMSIGAPLAEIERLLFAVTPAVDPVFRDFKDTSLGQPSTSCDCSTSRSRGGHGQMGFCSCRLGGVPLSAVWQWYEKSSNYGVEVRAIDSLHKGSVSDTYHAYFVPYLSGIQLYGYKEARSRNGRLCEQGEVNSCPKSDSKATLLLRDLDQGGQGRVSTSAQLLFEFFEGDLPPHRLPLLQKVQELLKSETSTLSQRSGDASCLESTVLGDLHPASWFAVAWYPIYRISDGPLRSVFLTYHSLHHGVPSNKLRCSLGQPADFPDGRISFPVVGLECYNTQVERWLSMGASVDSTIGGQVRSAANPSQILKQRLQSLQMTAAMMARGLTGGSKHLDYEFFVSRRR